MLRNIIVLVLLAGNALAQVTPNLKIQSLIQPALEKEDVSGSKGIEDAVDKFYYGSQSWYNWTELQANADRLQNELSEKRDSLTKHVLSKEGDSARLDKVMLTKVQARVAVLEGSRGKPGLAELQNAKADSAYLRYIEDFITYKKFNWRYGPVKSTALFNLMHENNGNWVSALNSAGVSIGGNTSSIYTELLGGSLGIFHLSLGTMIAVSSEDDEEKAEVNEAFQRLALAGGNTVLKLEYPLLYVHSKKNTFNLLVRSERAQATYRHSGQSQIPLLAPFPMAEMFT